MGSRGKGVAALPRLWRELGDFLSYCLPSGWGMLWGSKTSISLRPLLIQLHKRHHGNYSLLVYMSTRAQYRCTTPHDHAYERTDTTVINIGMLRNSAVPRTCVCGLFLYESA